MEGAHRDCGCYPAVGYHWQITMMYTRVPGRAWAGERHCREREGPEERVGHEAGFSKGTQAPEQSSNWSFSFLFVNP